MVDCNLAELLSRKQLARIVDLHSPYKVFERCLSSAIVHQVKAGIENSPLVKEYVKKAVRSG